MYFLNTFLNCKAANSYSYKIPKVNRLKYKEKPT